MTDRKFTDEEVIKALECCMRGNHCGGYCPYDDFEECTSKLTKDAIDLINRKKAEIERLQKYNTEVAFRHYNDGIKEFVGLLETVEEVVVTLNDDETITAVDTFHIHRIAKKMIGE